MNNKNLYLLLNIVKKNGNVKRLIHENLDFKEIADLTNQAIVNDLILFKEDNLILTTKGEMLYTKLEEVYKEKDKDKWIFKENISKIPKIEKDFIYLPNQKELNL